MVEAAQDKAGFISNVFLTLAYRLAEFRAFFGLSNRMAIVTGMQANPDFYTLARDARR